MCSFSVNDVACGARAGTPAAVRVRFLAAAPDRPHRSQKMPIRDGSAGSYLIVSGSVIIDPDVNATVIAMMQMLMLAPEEKAAVFAFFAGRDCIIVINYAFCK